MEYKLGLTLNELKIGDCSSYTKTFTEQDVFEFAKISGDNNPVHLDENFAKTTRFGARIVHGALVSSLFSTVFGDQFPGHGSIYFRQDSKFIAPVYLNDTITATVRVTEIEEAKGRAIFETIATNQNNQSVIVGTAVVYPRKEE